jgi:hypothetical protein
MLTAKGKYGLKALAYLSTLKPGEKAQAVEIAKADDIPKKFLPFSVSCATPASCTAKRVLGAAICSLARQRTSNSAR